MTDLVIPRPSPGLDVFSTCQQIEAWAAETADVAAINDAKARLAAIEQYIAQTSTDGRKAVAAAMRRLEARIGEVIGAAKPGPPQSSVAAEDSLTKHERHEFRKLAAHPEIVNDVIDASSDDDPPSRSKVLKAIADERRTPEQQAADDHDAYVRRAAKRLIDFATGWDTFRRLRTSPERDELLAALLPPDREVVLNAEKELGWTTT